MNRFFSLSKPEEEVSNRSRKALSPLCGRGQAWRLLCGESNYHTTCIPFRFYISNWRVPIEEFVPRFLCSTGTKDQEFKIERKIGWWAVTVKPSYHLKADSGKPDCIGRIGRRGTSSGMDSINGFPLPPRSTGRVEDIEKGFTSLAGL
ncbi:hypothetical protein ACOSQ2_003154 [Xanthoceras sorbifolium]